MISKQIHVATSHSYFALPVSDQKAQIILLIVKFVMQVVKICLSLINENISEAVNQNCTEKWMSWKFWKVRWKALASEIFLNLFLWETCKQSPLSLRLFLIKRQILYTKKPSNQSMMHYVYHNVWFDDYLNQWSYLFYKKNLKEI